MTDLSRQLMTLAEYAHAAASLFSQATREHCRSCVTQISDLNRQALSELSDAERRFYSRKYAFSGNGLLSAYRLTDCVHRAFSASMLLPEALPYLPPLVEIAACNEQLSEYPIRILNRQKIDFFSLHLVANKGRGAHALLLSNYCATPAGQHLIPLALSIEAHRNALELACEQLLLEIE